jgi:feruloyl esterase
LKFPAIPLAVALAVSLPACGGGSDAVLPPAIPQLAQAQAAALATCTTLATNFSFANTTISSATVAAAGTLTNAGTPTGEHCVVTGRMNQRVSPVDGQAYAIGFEMRLPRDWNGRFLYQANGGLDGAVAPATGSFVGGGPLQTALQQGFAVISSDAGHAGAQNPLFGLDPQARLDYGYAAVGTLTPMAKALIRAAYGKAPDRSYIGGTSNGGRHTMVAAARYAADYDGYLAVSPGFNLPKAAVAQLWGAQQWAAVPGTLRTNLETALPQSERALVARAINARCDALDGVADGMVNDAEACRTAFDLQRDVPTCAGARDGTCLSAEQKTALAAVFAGARNSRGEALYSGWPFDPGLVQTGWADWKFRNSVGPRDAVAMAFVFQTPPADPAVLADTVSFALGFNVDTDAPKIFATNGAYAQSSMSFMTPPAATQLDTLRERGARMLVIQGQSDGVFSPDDTRAWYTALDARYAGRAAEFARFFRIPGMGHSRGGPATDQFDALTALVNWVEKGQAPERIVATARGAGNPGGVNGELPADWSASRTRPLCPYPLVARYKGGDAESAASFACER